MNDGNTFRLSRVYRDIERAVDNGYKLIVNQGGTSSTKTYSAIQFFVLRHLYGRFTGLTSFVSESFPHLRRGIMRDFINIMGIYYDPKRFSKTESIYSFDDGEIEFFSADDASKLRGGRRKRLFLNEANNVSGDAFDELDVRTLDFTMIDFNPVSEFWYHEKNLSNDPKTKFIHSTYLDGRPVLPKSTIEKIEARRYRDPNWWNVYGLGKLGNIEGLVYPAFSTCDELPAGGVRFFGMDFGFTNDPTTLIHCVIIGDSLYCDQLIFETGLTNDQIAGRLESLGVRKNYDEIFADAAEPKSIEEIRRRGFNIRPAPKTQDSVSAGIQKVNQYKQSWTKRSIDCIKEQRNHRYIQGSDGKLSNKPMDDFNHGLDGRRYAIFGKTTVTHSSAHRIAI